MMLLDTTTLAEYLAEATAALQAQAVVDALADPVDVKVYDGSGNLKGSGVMATPWATQAAGVITVAEVTGFSVSASGTPDSDWYLRFESGTRWLRGGFGLAGSGQECLWSLPTWVAGQAGTIGTGIIGVPSNAAPSLVGAPSSLSFTASVGGTYDFSVHKTDPDSDTPLTCELIGTAYTGVTIDSAGLLTVSAAAAAAVRELTIKISDPGGLSSEFVCTVTIAAVAAYTVSVSGGGVVTTRRVSDGQTWTGATINGTTIGAVAGNIIELATGTYPTLTLELRGSAAGQITVRPAAGALITLNSTATFRWNLRNVQYLTIDGATTNASAAYPIVHEPVPYRCGFKMTGAGNCTAWVKFAITTHLPKHVTIQYVEIAGSNTSGSCIHYQDDTGNRINTFPNQYREDLTIRYNYFHNAGGLYIGGNYEADETGGLETPCRRTTIEYNRIVNSSEENIGLKMHWEGPNYIRHNWLEGAGRDTVGAAIDQRNAVSVQCSTCYVHDNWIVNAGQGDTAQGVGLGPNGISLLSSNGPDISGVPSAGAGVPSTDFDEYGPFPYFLVEIFNNIIVDSAWNGINSRLGTLSASKGPGVVNLVPQLLKIYSNTICANGAAGSGYDGVNVAASDAVYAGSFIRNNILIGNDGSALAGYASTLGGSDNKTSGDTVGTLFEDPTAALYASRDYHLIKAVPVAGGSTPGTNVAGTDLDGDARSIATADMGAYEYP